MKLVLVAACLALASASAVNGDNIEKEGVAGLAAAEEPQKFYHESVGIPEATKIREAEEESHGETQPPADAHPYFIGVVITLTTDVTSVCGATMLSNTKAITAAHCWYDGHKRARQFELVFGSARLFSGGVRVKTSSVEMHASWNPNNMMNDVAMVTFNRVGFSSVIKAVAVASGSMNYAGSYALAVGFGRAGNSVGQLITQVNVQVLPNSVCQKTYGSSYIVPSTLCTNSPGGDSVCRSDSGGPLTATNDGESELIGVLSFSSAMGCQRGSPTAFARITSYSSWIQDRLLN